MKKTINGEEVDIRLAHCRVYARYWEDSKINGKEDDAVNPQMPHVKEDGEGNKCWDVFINLDHGQVLGWPEGVVADLHYKSCDENTVDLILHNGSTIKSYEGYVPKFLCPKRNGYCDYVIMHIDDRGFISDFNNNIDDILA